jgi:hypothetical protein
MLYRWFYRSLIAIGMALLIAAGVAFYIALPEPETTVDDPERTLTDVKTGQTVELSFVLHNPKSRPIRIIGLAEC